MEIALTATERENGPYCPFLLPQWLLRSSAEFKLFIPFFLLFLSFCEARSIYTQPYIQQNPPSP